LIFVTGRPPACVSAVVEPLATVMPAVLPTWVPSAARRGAPIVGVMPPRSVLISLTLA
jgi:hypothetical protein